MGRTVPTASMAAKSTAFFLLFLLAFYTPLLHGSPIKTIVVLVMENRSFDHMLGWMKKLNPEINGVDGSESNFLNAADPKSQQFFFKDQAHYVDPDPGHSFQAIREQIFSSNDTSANPPPMNGFAQQAFSMDNTSAMSADVMNGFQPDKVAVYKALVSEFAVFDRWFASVPASTQPNRLYVHSGTSAGATSNVASLLAKGYPQRTIFENVDDAGLSFGIYYQNVPSTMFYRNLRKLKYLNKFHLFGQFKRDASQGNLPNYVVLEPRYFDLPLEPGNDDHPSHDVYQGQMLVKEVYETLRASPQWNETLFIITYDEHGGYYDHVPTPINVPSPDGIVGQEPFLFNFDRLGVRVPTIMISPWIEKGIVVHSPNGSPTPTSEYEHSSIPATVKNIFNLPSPFLTKRDEWAGSFESIVQKLTSPRSDCPEQLPTPVKIRDSPANESAKLTEFQQELVQLAAVLKGEHILSSYSETFGKDMTVKEGREYIREAVKRFFEAGRLAKEMGVDEDQIVQMKPSLSTRSSPTPTQLP
ncbi:Non-specific phospholipase C2, partial [Cucurbita argyrosperma subsp. sororia]